MNSILTIIILGSKKKGKNPPPPPTAAAEDEAGSPDSPPVVKPGKIMFTLQKQTEDVKSKKVTDNGQTPLLVHFDKKQGAAMQVCKLILKYSSWNSR